MIETERLILRSWREADQAPFHAICADPQVMATLGPVMDRAQSDALILRVRATEAAHGMTFWAMERKADGALLGWCGLIPGAEGTPIAGEDEIGWRLGSAYWGLGYAREAAEATLDWGWHVRGSREIAAITAAVNRRSWALMDRLGMVRAADQDFDHPKVPPDSALRPHITYRIKKPIG